MRWKEREGKERERKGGKGGEERNGEERRVMGDRQWAERRFPWKYTGRLPGKRLAAGGFHPTSRGDPRRLPDVAPAII